MVIHWPDIRYTEEVQEKILEILGLTLIPENGLRVSSVEIHPDKLVVQFDELSTENFPLASPIVFHRYEYPYFPRKSSTPDSEPATYGPEGKHLY